MRVLRFKRFQGIALSSLALAVACGVSDRKVNEDPASGGSQSSSGGGPETGGRSNSGGTTSSGGRENSGGASGGADAGGTPGSGGAQNTGSTGSGGDGDASVPDAGSGGATGITVSVSSPSQTVYTNGTVEVQVVVSGGTADSVALRVDGNPLVNLTVPYQYSWNTTGIGEGSHSLTASATKGSETVTSSARTVVIDRTPPQLVSAQPPLPPATAANVFIDSPITATFSEPLLPSTVVPGSVTMNAGAVTVTPTLSSDGKTITIAPQGPLAVPSTVTAAITTAIRDLAGNALVAPASWNWQLPQWVRLGGAINAVTGQSVSSAAIQVEPAGAIVTSFVESDGTRRNGYVYRFAGNQWEPLGAALNVAPGQDVADIRLAAGALSGTTVVLREANNAYVRRWSGTAWASVGGAINPQGTVVSFISAAPVAPTQDALVVGLVHNFNDGTAASVVRWTGTAWERQGAVVSGGMDYNVLGPANVASRPNASPLLSISENNGTRTDSFVFQWGGTSWLPLGGAIDPNTGVILQNGPPIAVSTTGRPFVFLYESASLLGAASGRVREWSGTSWDVVGAAINPVTGQGLADGALGLDSADRPIVVLREPSGASARTNAYAVRWTGAAWTNMGGALNPVPAQDVTNASMAMDSKGRPAVVLTVSDGSVTNAYVYRSNN